MSEAWQTQEERGSGGLIQFIVWVALRIGHTAGRLLLFPICLYFLTFSVRARRASANYLRRILGRAPRFSELFRHYHCFASTLLDRPYFLTGRFKSYEIRVHGEEVMLAIHGSGRGGIMLGAHIGSFEVLRCLASTREWLDLKVMMDMNVSRRTESSCNLLVNGGLSEVSVTDRSHRIVMVNICRIDRRSRWTSRTCGSWGPTVSESIFHPLSGCWT